MKSNHFLPFDFLSLFFFMFALRTSAHTSDGSLRLSDGPNAYSGRLEIYFDGVWGTVCALTFNSTCANVACRHLGHFGAFKVLPRSTYGRGTGPVHLHRVHCDGGEGSLVPRLPDGEQGVLPCTHDDDVGIACVPVREEFTVRLMNGSTEAEGRFEVYLQGKWGAVCRDGWSEDNDRVICKHLGYPSAVVTGGRTFGRGSGPIHLTKVTCSLAAMECQYRLATVTSSCAQPEEVVGVACDDALIATPEVTSPKPTSEGSLRLVDGPNAHSGRLELFHGGRWGSVCQATTTWLGANVACRQIGFFGSLDTAAVHSPHHGRGSGPGYRLTASCIGLESSLVECPHYAVQQGVCSETLDVICVETPYPQPEFSVRLANGTKEGEGCVSVYYKGGWGGVCSESWGVNEAEVVCRQLGHPSARRAWSEVGGSSGAGWSPAVLAEVSCTGTATTLAECAYTGSVPHSCAERGSVGVECGDAETQGAPSTSGNEGLSVGGAVAIAVVLSFSVVTSVALVLLLASLLRKAQAGQTDHDGGSGNERTHLGTMARRVKKYSSDVPRHQLVPSGAGNPSPDLHTENEVFLSPP